MLRLVRIAALAIGGMAAAIVATCWIAGRAGYRVNLSESMPIGIYRESALAGAPDRFAIVSACLPAAIGRFGLARGYLDHGACAIGAGAAVAPIEKVVVGLPGDRISRAGGALVVRRGGQVARVEGCGAALARDPSRRPMGAWSGTVTVASRAVFLCGLNRLSWDSRYYGPVPIAGLRGTERPVWIASTQGGAWRLLESWEASARVLRANYGR